jgi:hypothetical protein
VDLTVRPEGDRESWGDLSFAIFYLLSSIACFRWLRLSYAVVALELVVLPMTTSSIISLPRYGIVAFPIYLLLAKFGKKPLVDKILTPLALAANIFFMILYTVGAWVS